MKKLRQMAFQPYHQILCILKHVEDVEDRSSTPMGCNAIYVEDIEDCKYLQYTQDLNIKEVMSTNMFELLLKTLMNYSYLSPSSTPLT